jgi:hypothetical protein
MEAPHDTLLPPKKNCGKNKKKPNYESEDEGQNL